MGPHVLYSESALITGDSNRHLLVEMCTSLGMAIANTFFAHPVEEQATCYNIGAQPGDPISCTSHGQIDFLLVPQDWLHNVEEVHSNMSVALASHHFLLAARIAVCVPKVVPRMPNLSYDRTALGDRCVAHSFATFFDASMEENNEEGPQDVDLVYAKITDAFHASAEAVLPLQPLQPKRPWISSRTLALLDKRNIARREHRHLDEKALAKEVKSSVGKDRAQWLDSLVATGEWNQIRKLRKNPTPQQGRLKDLSGSIVSSEQRAETLADYLQNVQWSVRPVSATFSQEVINENIHVEMGEISENEVVQAGQQLKRNRAPGPDDIPAEFWKAILIKGSPSARWAVEFCNTCWHHKSVPDAWHAARVATIFKKGDPASCANYRPISLLAIGYKLFAIILLERLRAAGADAKTWPTQFAFKRGRGTTDALFLARRILEDACAMKNGKAILLALDWAKAFDSVSPDALSRALVRFGLPQGFVDTVPDAVLL